MSKNTMKHDEIPEMAADLYLMNELPAADRDAFKAHLSECVLCKTQVRAGEAFRELLSDPREVPDPMPFPAPAEPQRRPIRSRWLNRILPVAASFAIAVFGTYATAVRPLQKALTAALQPGVGSDAVLREVRGNELPTVDNSRGYSVLNVIIQGDGRSTVYTYTITGGTGTLYTRTINAEDVNTHDSVPIVVPKGTLPPDDYTLRIDTKPRISTYLFRVRSD